MAPTMREGKQVSHLDAANPSNFLYQNLRDSNEIRLLHLHPGSSLERIECTLLHGTFSKQPQYEALSYKWGPEDVIRTITINGSDFQVRDNLWSALQHLRLISSSRVLWIDAICIHQRNLHERNHQVSQMGKIYNAATRVVVWLGPSDPDSSLASGLLSREWSVSLEANCSPTAASKKNEELAAILSVLSRPYWKRLWIIQEFLMAREFIIQCGNEEFRASWIYWFTDQLRTTLRNPEEDTSNPMFCERTEILNALAKVALVRFIRQRLCSVYGDGSNFFGLNLFQLVSTYEDAECLDQRDNIFGLYSLAPVCCKKANPVDYSLTWNMVLKRLLHHQIYFHNSLPKNIQSSSPETVVSKVRSFYHQARTILHEGSRASTESTLRLAHSSADWIELETVGRINKHQLLEFKGYVRGRVCYVRPPSNQKPPPNLTPRLKLQLKHICSLGVNASTLQQPYITTGKDVVGVIGMEHMIDSLSIKFANSHILSRNSITYWGSNFPAPSCNEIDEASCFRKLLMAAENRTDTLCDLAFEENGLIMIAMHGVQVGDLVCQFPDSDVLLILHQNTRAEEYVSASRAVNFLASDFGVAADICGIKMRFDGMCAEMHAVSFEAGSMAVKALCKASEGQNTVSSMFKTVPGT